MDHVKPMLAQIICDSKREKGKIARFAMTISGIFIRKVTKLLGAGCQTVHSRQIG